MEWAGIRKEKGKEGRRKESNWDKAEKEEERKESSWDVSPHQLLAVDGLNNFRSEGMPFFDVFLALSYTVENVVIVQLNIKFM